MLFKLNFWKWKVFTRGACVVYFFVTRSISSGKLWTNNFFPIDLTDGRSTFCDGNATRPTPAANDPKRFFSVLCGPVSEAWQLTGNNKTAFLGHAKNIIATQPVPTNETWSPDTATISRKTFRIVSKTNFLNCNSRNDLGFVADVICRLPIFRRLSINDTENKCFNSSLELVFNDIKVKEENVGSCYNICRIITLDWLCLLFHFAITTKKITTSVGIRHSLEPEYIQ